MGFNLFNKYFKKVDNQQFPLKLYDSTLHKSTYFGVQIQKNPLDLFLYQEILYKLKPDFIIEIGSLYGGSALYFSHILDLLGHGEVISIDISHSHIYQQVKEKTNITLIESDAKLCFDKVKTIVKDKKCFVIEDSSHEYENTLQILIIYSALVSIGSYFIVEDTVCHHGLEAGPFPGPYEAVQEFLKLNDSFEIDFEMHKFVLTFNPNGFLKRVK